MANDIAKTNDAALPAYLQGAKKEHSVGNVDRSKLIIPRVKLLQAVSPEVTEYNNAKAGEFWHNMAEQSLGKSLTIVPVKMRQYYTLWAPRGDERGMLARASDGVRWDQPDQEFRVKPKGYPKEVVYKIGKTVSDTGLDRFGSSIPDDPNSPPAASLVVEWLFLFPDYLEFGPAIVLNTRSSIKPANLLISKIELRPVDHFAQQFKAEVVEQTVDGDKFYNYRYTSDGFASEECYNRAKELFEYYNKNEYEANDIRDDAQEQGPSTRGGPSESKKF